MKTLGRTRYEIREYEKGLVKKVGFNRRMGVGQGHICLLICDEEPPCLKRNVRDNRMVKNNDITTSFTHISPIFFSFTHILLPLLKGVKYQSKPLGLFNYTYTEFVYHGPCIVHDIFIYDTNIINKMKVTKVMIYNRKEISVHTILFTSLEIHIKSNFFQWDSLEVQVSI